MSIHAPFSPCLLWLSPPPSCLCVSGEVSLSVYSGPTGAMTDLRYMVRSKKSGKVAVEGTFTCTMQSQ